MGECEDICGLRRLHLALGRRLPWGFLSHLFLSYTLCKYYGLCMYVRWPLLSCFLPGSTYILSKETIMWVPFSLGTDCLREHVVMTSIIL